MGQLLFWMNNPPAPGIPLPDWHQFRSSMAGLIIACVLLTVIVIVTTYAIHARRKRIRRPADLFAAYTPMWWLAWSLLPGIAVFGLYIKFYYDTFPPQAKAFAMGGATQVGLWTVVLTFTIAYLLILFPGLTPGKFRYRPLPTFLHRWRMRS